MPSKQTNRRGYIPGADAQFASWLNFLVNYTVEKTSGQTPAWDHIPSSRVTELVDLNAQWRTAFAKMEGPHTSVDTKTKNNARKEVTVCVRAFVAQYLRFPPVTDEDREAMGIPNKDVHPSRIDPPKTRPVITKIKPLGAFREEIYFHDEATEESNAIPYGCNGCLLTFTCGPKAVEKYKELIQTKLMTHSPYIITLPQEAENQVFSCATQWQNERGELGPLSEIETAVVWR
ncbi:MAG: hypothetical protein LBH75_09305 [Treponema sp.]|nr:hypothetical protein [Treponema sp.]